MRKRHASLNFILETLNNKFGFDVKRSFNQDDIDWPFVVEFSKTNNILFHVARDAVTRFGDSLPAEVHDDLAALVETSEVRLQQIRQALILLDELFPGQHVLIKTHRVLDRIPSDIDFLVPDFEAGIDICKTAGLRLEPSGHKEMKTNFFTEQNVNLHLHGRVEWVDREFMDSRFILEAPRRVSFNGVEVSIPNITADYLMHLAHMSYESLHVTLAELPYLFLIKPDADLPLCREQAAKYHWIHSYRRVDNILDGLRRHFFEKDLTDERLAQEVAMPHTLSRLHLILSFLERGVIIEPLLKLPKVLKVLFSGDAYKGFYQPAEDQSRWKA